MDITSEQRTESPAGVSRPRRVCPLQRVMSAGKIRNKSGTAEDLCAFVSYRRQRHFFISIC